MRQRILLDSVRTVLGPGHDVVSVAVVSFVHRWAVGFSVLGAVSIVVVGWVSGVRAGASLVALAIAGAAVAVLGTTEQHIVAGTTTGRFLLRAGRFRQVAVERLAELPAGIEFRRITGNIATAEWRIDGRSYRAMRRADLALTAMAGR